VHDAIDAFARLHIGENKGPLAALFACIAFHDFERRPDVS